MSAASAAIFLPRHARGDACAHDYQFCLNFPMFQIDIYMPDAHITYLCNHMATKLCELGTGTRLWQRHAGGQVRTAPLNALLPFPPACYSTVDIHAACP